MACFYVQQDLFGRCGENPLESIPAALSGKMFRELFLPMVARISVSSSRKSSKPRFQILLVEDGQTPGWFELNKELPAGECWTLNFGEYPREGKESSLSQIYQGTTEQKYYLSPRACQGILRRIARRKKKIPGPLLEAIRVQARITEPS